MIKRIKYNKQNNQGIVLIFTIAIIAILAVIILEFNYLSRVDLNIAYNLRDALQSEYLAKSAVNMAIALLREDDNFAVDSLDEDWAKDMPAASLPGGRVCLKITDEERKVNVSKYSEKKRLVEQIERLLNLLKEDKTMAEQIINKAPYETIGDIRNKQINAKLMEYLTVLGSGNININTASLETIESLSPLVNGEIARNIVEFRKKKAFKDIVELSPAYQYDKPQGITPEIYNDIKNYITVASTIFLVEATATLNQSVKKIEAVIKREGNNCDILYWRDISYD